MLLKMWACCIRLLTGADETVEVRDDAVLERVFHAAYLTREKALLTVRRQFAVAKNVQKIKNASKES